MSNKIAVVGSINMDMVITTPRIPAMGETIAGEDFMLSPGGKGANQAVVAAKLGGEVFMVGKVGDDIFGRDIVGNMKNLGIDTSGIITEKGATTGVAIVTVCEGNNNIILHGGANSMITPDDVERHRERLLHSNAVMLQLEIPYETVLKVIEIVKDTHVKIFFNPAPARKMEIEVFKGIDFITPNESECEIITGINIKSIEDAFRAIKYFRQLGVRYPLVTLGSEGVAYFNGKDIIHKSVKKVKRIDTTAAGDTFSGAMAVAIARGDTIDEAVDFGNKAATIAVTRKGAQNSVPYLNEIEPFFEGLDK